jgi:hypothetical protein
MTQQEIKDAFLTDLRLSLQSVSPLYYGLNYWHHTPEFMRMIDPFVARMLQPYLDRYHERVFCYEFYFRMRSRMEQLNNPDGTNAYVSKHIYLQSEVRKDQINRLLEKFLRVTRLSRSFMPDFILHTPGDFSNQLFVMEVKATPVLSLQSIQYDLRKIQEFITSYRYHEGIFLAVNIEERRRDQLLEHIRNWALAEAETPDRIRVIFKSDPESEIFEQRLSDLL